MTGRGRGLAFRRAAAGLAFGCPPRGGGGGWAGSLLSCCAFAALIAVFPPEAQAQTVLVLSGEHDGFSRLALVLPGPGGWTIIPAAGGYVLRLEAPGIALDTSRVFDLIPRDRIASVVARPDGLFLSVTCECHLRSFEDRPGVLVIDVVSGPDPADAEQAPLSARTPAPRPDTRVTPMPFPGPPTNQGR